MRDYVVWLGITIQIDIWFGCVFLKKKKLVINQPVKSFYGRVLMKRNLLSGNIVKLKTPFQTLFFK